MRKNLNFHVPEEMRERFRFLASYLGVSQVDLFVLTFEYFGTNLRSVRMFFLKLCRIHKKR